MAAVSAAIADDTVPDIITDQSAGVEDDRGFVKWELSYHTAIRFHIGDYRRCLNYGNRIVRGEPDMEMQHRADVPRCRKARDEAIEASINTLRDREIKVMNEDDVREAFRVVGLIHIERGKNIDDQFVRRRAALEAVGRASPMASDQ